MRIAKSFTIDPDVDNYVATTKGEQSASERVNELLRRAMLQEMYDHLENEAESFFAADHKGERAETRAFQTAAMRTLRRD